MSKAFSKKTVKTVVDSDVPIIRKKTKTFDDDSDIPIIRKKTKNTYPKPIAELEPIAELAKPIAELANMIEKENDVTSEAISLTSEDLEVVDNGGVSYIVKKYINKSIISIYRYRLSQKSGLIATKWFRNFFSENQAYLAELGKEKYEYIFVGGNDIYEFSLIPGDKFVSFNCYIGNSCVRYVYVVGEKYTYFLTEKCAMENSLIKDKDPYISLYNEKEDEKVYFELCDKSKYFMGKPGKIDINDISIKVAIKEEVLNDDLDKLEMMAEKIFNDIEKRYIDCMMEFNLTFMKSNDAKKSIKKEMDMKKTWSKFRSEYFKTSVKGVEVKNRVSYFKRCVEDYLNMLYKPESSSKNYRLFIELWNSSF